MEEWAAIALLYVLIEVVRFVRLLATQRHLRAHRTPLSAGFDRRQWGASMLAALGREASLGKAFMSTFLSSTFFEKPISSLSRGDMDYFLRMYLSCLEPGVDGPVEPWADKMAEEALTTIEEALDHRFAPGDATHPFVRVNHPIRNDHPIEAMLRPLPVAIGFWLIRAAGDTWLRYLGYERHVDEATGFVFWRLRRRQPMQPRDRRAVVFISGLGQGQSFYPHHAAFFARDGAMGCKYSDVCLCELPGVSGVPLRADQTYPTAREAVEAVERFTRTVLELQCIDGVAHSAGAFTLSYASRYAPALFEKEVYAEAPCVFFTHGSKSWPFLFTKFNLMRLLRGVWTLDGTGLANWFIMSEVNHQHVLKNATWFMECCHREEAGSLGRSTLLIVGTKDHYVNGAQTTAYMRKFHPDVRVHCMEGWEHGAFWDPTNFGTVKGMLRNFLCDDGDGSLLPSTSRQPESATRPMMAETERRNAQNVLDSSPDSVRAGLSRRH